MLEGTRLDELREEVSRLKLRREGATSERWLLWLGAALAVAGVVLLVGAYSSSHGTRDPLVQQDDVILALLGVSLAVIGSAVWFRHSLTRYFRYWLTRMVHEQRAQADRVVEAVSRVDTPPRDGQP